MKDQPWNLSQTWPVPSVDLQMPPNIWGTSPNLGRKNIKFVTTFRDFCTRHCLSPELNVASTNQNTSVSIYNVFPNSWHTFRDFWPQNGWDLLAHCDPPYESSAFSVVAGFPHKGQWTQANQILPYVRGLTIHRKNFGKIRPKTFHSQPKLTFLANTFFATSTLDTAYLRNEMSRWQNKILVSIYNIYVSPKIWPTFRDLWRRNGWDPFAHCDPPFGSHYVATIIVATCLVRLRLLDCR